tara:strand:+ start:3382 stop:3504 length:123 start_codon:yes stop_codon:yes gene_type:complete
MPTVGGWPCGIMQLSWGAYGLAATTGALELDREDLPQVLQ